MALARDARMIRATMPNLWSMADQLREYTQDQHPLLERPEPVEDLCRPLSAGMYPLCPLCRLDVNGCDCDPDEKGDALWLQFQRERAA